MKALSKVLALIALLAGTNASAELSKDRSIEVVDAWARIAPTEPDTVNVFFEVLSHADKSDSLMSASSAAAEKVILRRGKFTGLNFSNEPTRGIEIKAYGRTSLRPGVFEVTLSKFTAPASVGMTLPITLVFKEAGTVDIGVTLGNRTLDSRAKK